VTEYSLAIILPPEHSARVLEARKAVLGDEHPYAPHVTVKSPFSVEGDRAAVLERIATIAGSHRPFVVQVTGVGSFHGPIMNVIFLHVKPTAELRGLHMDVASGLADATRYSRPYGATLELDNYVPHVTVAANLTEEQYAAGLATLDGEKPSFSFTCTHLTLGVSDDGKTWTLLADYPLSEAPATPDFVAHDTVGFDPD
jgi:2'-5' RNA ligase